MTNQISNLKDNLNVKKDNDLTLVEYLNIQKMNYIIDIGVKDLIATNEELLAEIMELPLEIFLSDKENLFELFIYQFLKFSELCILDHHTTNSSSIAIINKINNISIALVAWKVNNILLVFDIIKVTDNFSITDNHELELVENLEEFLGVPENNDQDKTDFQIIEIDPLPERIFLMMLKGVLLIPVNGDIDDISMRLDMVNFSESEV